MHPTKEQKSWCRCVWYKFGRDRGAGIQISGHRSKFLIIKSLNSLRRAHFHVHDMVFDCATASALTLCCHWLAADALCGVCSSYQPRIIAQLLYIHEAWAARNVLDTYLPILCQSQAEKKLRSVAFGANGTWRLGARTTKCFPYPQAQSRWCIVCLSVAECETKIHILFCCRYGISWVFESKCAL